jgi:alkylation response protein AidB-like acyl-CoA dehydrogenase
VEFGWSEAQRALHERMRALGADVARAEGERIERLASGGALGLCLPAEHGGGGESLVSTAYAYEGLGATLDDGGLLLAAGAHLFGVAMTVAKVGTPEQKAAWLPALASGRTLATVAVTEQGAGSDVAASEAVVGAEGATGDKRYVTYAAGAHVYLFVGKNAAGRGLTAALVERDLGVEVGEPLDTAGLRGARLAPVRFRGAPVAATLGKAGAGMAVFQIAMAYERALVLAFRLGAMERQLAEALAFVKKRGVGKHQAVTHRVAEMKRRLEAARLMTYRAAWALDQGQRAQLDAALAKWLLADAAVASALDALALRGGAGYLEGAGLTAELDDTLGGAIHSGTGDVLANIVAAWLGL